MRGNSFRWTVAAATGIAVILAVATAQSLPRYTAQYDTNCNLCHYTPTGGGQRELYATQFIVPAEMSLASYDPDKPSFFDPKLSESVILGADLRTFFFEADGNSGAPENFFQMEGNVYLTLKLDPRYSLHYQIGTRQTPEELYGLGYMLPWNGYLKVGQYVPAFGWRFDDHTHYVRDAMGWNPPVTDVGVEAGMFPEKGRWSLVASVLNGSISSRDFDENVEVVLRAERKLRLGSAALGIGASYLYNETASGTQNAAGPLWYFALGKLIWVGELDFSGLEPPGGSTKTALFTSNEVTFTVKPGLEILGTFDYLDPDQDLDTGSTTRFGFGCEVRPYAFLKLSGMFNANLITRGDDVAGSDYNQIILQVHLMN